MHMLLDLALAFVLLGLSEALIKPIAKRLVQRRLLAAAPRLFAQLDPLLPGLLQHASGEELEALVRRQLGLPEKVSPSPIRHRPEPERPEAL